MSGHGKNEKIVLIISGFLYLYSLDFLSLREMWCVRKKGLRLRALYQGHVGEGVLRVLDLE